jgi:hypothetical protein
VLVSALSLPHCILISNPSVRSEVLIKWSTNAVLRRGMSTKRETARRFGKGEGGKRVKWKGGRKTFGRFGLLLLNWKFYFFRYSIRNESAIWQDHDGLLSKLNVIFIKEEHF